MVSTLLLRVPSLCAGSGERNATPDPNFFVNNLLPVMYTNRLVCFRHKIIRKHTSLVITSSKLVIILSPGRNSIYIQSEKEERKCFS